MCDYSLMHVQNRLAAQGEELTTHHFSSGAIGLASPSELQARADWQTARLKESQSMVGKVKQATVYTKAPVVCAICIPPGVELTLSNIPDSIQQQCGVSSIEHVTFDQLDIKVNNYRDAFRFDNGHAVLIQDFGTGVDATVLSMENATEREAAVEEYAMYPSH
jgi:hypothetical protein